MLLRRRKFKRWSVRPQNTSRVDNVEFSLVQKLREMDEEEFFGHSRMPRSKYDSLAGRILFSPPVRKHKADTSFSVQRDVKSPVPQTFHFCLTINTLESIDQYFLTRINTCLLIPVIEMWIFSDQLSECLLISVHLDTMQQQSKHSHTP